MKRHTTPPVTSGVIALIGPVGSYSDLVTAVFQSGPHTMADKLAKGQLLTMRSLILPPTVPCVSPDQKRKVQITYVSPVTFEIEIDHAPRQ